MNVMMFAAGIINLATGVMLLYMALVPMIKCKTLVYGRCAGLETVRGYRGAPRCYPNFEYEFGGNRYHGRSLFTIKQRAISMYSYGMTRSIWIDENDPKKYIARRLSAPDIFLLIIVVGSVFSLGGLFVYGSIFVA